MPIRQRRTCSEIGIAHNPRIGLCRCRNDVAEQAVILLGNAARCPWLSTLAAAVISATPSSVSELIPVFECHTMLARNACRAVTPASCNLPFQRARASPPSRSRTPNVASSTLGRSTSRMLSVKPSPFCGHQLQQRQRRRGPPAPASFHR